MKYEATGHSESKKKHKNEALSAGKSNSNYNDDEQDVDPRHNDMSKSCAALSPVLFVWDNYNIIRPRFVPFPRCWLLSENVV